MGKELEFQIIDEADITDHLDRAIRESLMISYPNESDQEHFSHRRWWHSRHQWTVAALNGEGVVASGTCVVERRVTAGNRKLDIAGVGNVFALPLWRKTGLVDRVMSLTLEEAGRRGLEAGLLFCLPALEKVYARIGWKKVEADVVMRDESGMRVPIPSKNITMAIPILLKEFPVGDIDIMGRDW